MFTVDIILGKNITTINSIFKKKITSINSEFSPQPEEVKATSTVGGVGPW